MPETEAVVSAQSGQPIAEIAEPQSRAALIERVVRIGALLVLITLSFYGLLYLRTGSRQIFIDASGLLIGLACLAFAYWSVWRQDLDAAGYSLLLTLALAYGASELAWSGETWFNAIGGVLAVFLVGSIVLPDKRLVWSFVAGLYATYVWLVNQVAAIPRPDASEVVPVLFVFDLGLTILLIVLALWLIFRVFLVGTIRIRLLASYVMLVVLFAIATGASAVLIGSENTRRRVIDQLESVATLKQAEIETWIDDLRDDLAMALIGEEALTDALRLLGAESAGPQMRETSRQRLGRRFQEIIAQTEQFDELFVVDTQGQVLRSSNPLREGLLLNSQPYFREGLERTYISPPIYSDSPGEMSVVAAYPIRDQGGRIVGILAGRANLTTLNTLMLERAGLGETGETYLVGLDNALLTTSRFEGYPAGKTLVDTSGANAALKRQKNGSGLYDGYRGEPVIGAYRWLPELQVALLAEQDQSEALSASQTIARINIGVSAGALIVAITAGLFMTRSIANPLRNLAAIAVQVAGGDTTRGAQVERQDEIGELAQAFNSMTAQLNELIEGLEAQVAQRTRDLEHRSAYLEAASEVGRTAASILEADRLVRQVVELIRNRFGLYYVGLFGVDEKSEWAQLRAGTGTAGQAMLARGHRIRIGEGMIGWSIANAQPRVALEAECDTVRLATDELPNTQSEAALPLRSRGQVLGALTVQSDRPGFFDADILTMLQTMADQVAVALDNAHLFTEIQAAVEAQRRAYGQISQEAWLELLSTRRDLGFRRDKQGVSRITEYSQQREGPVHANQTEITLDEDEGMTTIKPVKVRDRVIGVVKARRSKMADQWTAEEADLLDALVDQLGQALESARLYQETHQRAWREQLTRQITEKVRAVPDVDTIAQTAAEELAKALGGARGFVKLSTKTLDENGHEDAVES